MVLVCLILYIEQIHYKNLNDIQKVALKKSP